MARSIWPALAAAVLLEEVLGRGGEALEDGLGKGERSAGAECDGAGFGDCDRDGSFRDGGGSSAEAGELLDNDDDGLGDDGEGVGVVVMVLGRRGRRGGN